MKLGLASLKSPKYIDRISRIEHHIQNSKNDIHGLENSRLIYEEISNVSRSLHYAINNNIKLEAIS
jgi:hypothetical protein